MGFIARQWGSPSVEETENQDFMNIENTPRPDVEEKGKLTKSVFSPLPMNSSPAATPSGAFEKNATIINSCGSPRGAAPGSGHVFESIENPYVFHFVHGFSGCMECGPGAGSGLLHPCAVTHGEINSVLHV